MPRIAWIDEEEATGQLAELYGKWRKNSPQRKEIPGILKAFSQRPDFLEDVMSFAYRVHFSDGHLPVRTKEMIATYVSGLNQCGY